MGTWGSNTRIALASLALGVMGALAGAQPSRGQATTPPLLPGEMYAVTANGCGMIEPKAATYDEIARWKAEAATFVWSGECAFGLVQGAGRFNTWLTHERHRGRDTGRPDSTERLARAAPLNAQWEAQYAAAESARRSAASGVGGTGVSAVALVPPPLLPGEVIIDRPGCGFIFSEATVTALVRAKSASTASREAVLSELRAYQWTGGCADGLLNGKGKLSPPQFMQYASELTYRYGRPQMVQTGQDPNGRSFTLYTMPGGAALFDRAGAPDPLLPLWSAPSAERLIVAPDRGALTAVKRGCATVTALSAPDCTTANNYDVFGMLVTAADGAQKYVWCPTPRTTEGCDALWREYATPIAERRRAVIAEVTARQPEIEAKLSAMYADYGPRVAAAAAARSAAKAREERAFSTSLTTLGAGQLFTRADEFDRAGETEKARATRSALINRFPNSPLAATAAQQIAGGGATSAMPTGGAAGATPGRAVQCATPNTGSGNPAFRQFDAANQSFINQWPNLNTTGARDQYQYTMFVMANANRILEEHKSCLSQRDYDANKTFFDNAAGAAKRGCEQLTASAGDCRPVYPWQSSQRAPQPQPRREPTPLTCSRGYHPGQRGNQTLCVQDPAPQCGAGMGSFFNIQRGEWGPCVSTRAGSAQ